MNVEALRTWKTKRNGDRVATIELLVDGEVVQKVGGARCARAEAVVACTRNDVSNMHIFGVRGNMMNAITEANRMETATTFTIQGDKFPTKPWPYAKAIKVTDKPE